MAAKSMKINMGVGGYSTQETGFSFKREEKTANFVVTFVQGREGKPSSTIFGKLIRPDNNPEHKVRPGSTWEGVLIDRGDYFRFKPVECLREWVRQSGDYVITPQGVIIQTLAGTVFLSGENRLKGINFKVYARVVERFSENLSENVFIYEEGARSLVSNKQQLEGFSFKRVDCPGHRHNHSWAFQEMSEGFAIYICPICGSGRYSETMPHIKSERQSGSKFTPKKEATIVENHPLSAKKMHRRTGVHKRKSGKN